MKLLFIGGTGIISSACTALAAKRGMEVTLLTRGQHEAQLPLGVKTLVADVNDPAISRQLERESYDAVVDFIAFTPVLFRWCVLLRLSSHAVSSALRKKQRLPSMTGRGNVGSERKRRSIARARPFVNLVLHVLTK